MRKLNVVASARDDIRRVIRFSFDTFGELAARKYRALLSRAMRDLQDDPTRAGVTHPDELPKGLQVYHLRHSRNRVSTRSRPKGASHLILFRFDDTDIFVLRVLHEAMDLAQHTSAVEMPPRESEVIDEIEYNEGLRQLRVTFTAGRVYIYLDVPIDEADAFKAAESKGRHFNTHIRDRYAFRRMR